MDAILAWIDTLSSFEQNLIASAAFGLTSLIFQALAKKARSKGSKIMKVFAELDVSKHVLHKEYVRSTNMQLASFGASVAMLQAARWVVRGMLVMIFFFGIHSIVYSDWLYVAAAWFTFNCILEASNWLKDSSSEKSISHVPDEVKNRIYEKLRPKTFEELNKETENGQHSGEGSSGQSC